jgi:hypothetical protein
VRALGQQLGLAWLGPPPRPGEDWQFDAARDGRRFRLVKSISAVSVVALVVAGALTFALVTRSFLTFWAQWNYSGYEDTAQSSTKPKAYGEYRGLINAMGALPPGRAMWEGGSSIDAYGTSLALMLLPYWTDGRIGSMEGLYYESAATTPYQFMSVAPLSGPGSASNPVRGLDYRTIEDFDLGVRYLRLLGVSYYLAHTTEAKTRADVNPGLRLVDQVPDRDKLPPSGWNIYEVLGARTVARLRYEPVVVDPKGARQSACFDREPVEGQKDPKLGAWECVATGWWDDPEALDRPIAADGPESWARVPAARADDAPRKRLPPVRITDVRETDDSVSFRVSRTGVPVVVRTSYYPNWSAEGADGPWRLTPNFMVVVPTSRSVTLHYDRSGPEWLGLGLSVVGLGGLAGLVVWRPRDEEAGDDPAARADERSGDGPGDGPGAGPDDGPGDNASGADEAAG